MSKDDTIHIKGARQHNLRNLELRLPRGQLTVITGVSGSGKSSLAFDTLYAEGYRKFIDSLSTRARGVLDQVSRPEVDFIHGLSPVIAIEQRTAEATNPRSTVATITEIADYARLLWSLAATPYCPKDGGRIIRRSLDDCLGVLFREGAGRRALLLAPFMEAKPAALREPLEDLVRRGYQRIRVDGVVRRLDERDPLEGSSGMTKVELVVDRVVVEEGQRSRVADSLELAFREGRDQAVALVEDAKAAGGWREIPLSQHLSCEICGTVYAALIPRHFSYDHPLGACENCGGLGQTMQFADELVVPDPSLSVRGGAIKPWRLGSKRMIIRHNAILKQLAEQVPFDPKAPWSELEEEVHHLILHGGGERLFSFKLTGGNKKPEVMRFEGVLADLEEIRRETSSDGLRARLMAYQVTAPCESCQGQRLGAYSRAAKLGGYGFADFMAMDIERAYSVAREMTERVPETAALSEAVGGLVDRLRFLHEVGLGYLTLNRTYSTLSGGESQRVRLATQLGMGLVGVLYVLDEPSIGLHPLDNRKLIGTLQELRDRGNTVVVVEHDGETMLAADRLIELGPGAGAEGGALLFEGSPEEIQTASKSLSGPFLSRERGLHRENPRRMPTGRGWLTVKGAREHNLRDLDVRFPVGALSVVTGVSGSGKSTLVLDILARAAARKLNRAKALPGNHVGIEGLDEFRTLVEVDQSPIGRSPRSNPATYTKVFDGLRALFAQAPLARVRGYTASRFSFNTTGGRCERCRGDGAIKLDMQFLADVYAPCPSCGGKRYNRETLEVRYKGYNIADVLEMTVDESAGLFRHHRKVSAVLETLRAVGLGYVRLGQPAQTLSGGEAQRIKLSLELAKRTSGEALYILDEPTTGLHWIDVQKLLDLLDRLVEAGNTVILIEHNLDLVNLADWVVDLGPGGGKEGGELVYSGPVRGLMECGASATGKCLRDYLAANKATV